MKISITKSLLEIMAEEYPEDFKNPMIFGESIITQEMLDYCRYLSDVDKQEYNQAIMGKKDYDAFIDTVKHQTKGRK